MNINIMEYLPFLIPIILIELALMITALVHVLRHKTYRFGNRVLWIIIVVVLEIVGPILYFTIGRGEE
ncbi:MAG TPA: PLDc N-terminal domain-containing protein [Mobilitalea sp.]|nr:PLDc N-terminal domain-containing protein [Mobilitalea sp.]